MFENIMRFFRKMTKKENKIANSKEQAKERLHLVLMQDRANVSADFLDLMRQEIIDVIKKYIEVDENAIDVRLTNKDNGDGTTGAPALYANIPITKIKDELKTTNKEEKKESNKLQKEKNEKTKKNVSQVNKEKKKQETNNEVKENIEIIENSNEKKENDKENKNNEINNKEQELEENNENNEKQTETSSNENN